MRSYPLYLFDVDGTLVDSADDICGAVLDVLRDTPCGGLGRDDLTRYIGVHLLAMFEDLLPGREPAYYDGLIARYRALYPAREHASTRVYPGVEETLAALPGRKSTATTKATSTTRLVLDKFGLLPYFDHVQGTDGFPCKPAPDVLLASLAVFGVAPEDCLFVGDSAADMEAGRRAGVRTCAVRYGYGIPGEMARFGPDHWVDDLRELL